MAVAKATRKTNARAMQFAVCWSAGQTRFLQKISPVPLHKSGVTWSRNIQDAMTEMRKSTKYVKREVFLVMFSGVWPPLPNLL
jgi:hypothetical protein